MTFDTHLKFAYIFQSKRTQFQNLPLFQANQTSFYKFNEHLSITINAKNRTIERKSLEEWQKKKQFKKIIFSKQTHNHCDYCHFSHEYPCNMCSMVHCNAHHCLTKFQFSLSTDTKHPKYCQKLCKKHSRRKKSCVANKPKWQNLFARIEKTQWIHCDIITFICKRQQQPINWQHLNSIYYSTSHCLSPVSFRLLTRWRAVIISRSQCMQTQT